MTDFEVSNEYPGLKWQNCLPFVKPNGNKSQHQIQNSGKHWLKPPHMVWDLKSGNLKYKLHIKATANSHP